MNPASLDDCLKLYDERRFVDCYRAVGDRWREDALPGASALELAHAARLALRLGSPGRARKLIRLARERGPEEPWVRYVASYADRGGEAFLDQLAAFEANPALAGADDRLQADWFATWATRWAGVGDFARAHDLIEQARRLAASRDEAWIGACAANVFLTEDRWPEAEREAAAAFERSPTLLAAASMRCRTLLYRGASDEVVAAALRAVGPGQSYEALLFAVGYLALAVERFDPGDGTLRAERLAKARELAGRIAGVLPLAERFHRSMLARVRRDLADLGGDHGEMLRALEDDRSFFGKAVADSLRNHPEGRRYWAPHRAVYQKRLACVPASMAALDRSVGASWDEDVIARELTYDGTALWRAADWLAAQGCAARVFRVDAASAEALLTRGLPFLYSTRYVDPEAHCMAAVGLDTARRTLIVHDPSNDRYGEILLDHIGLDEAPFGPIGIAFAAAGRAGELEAVPLGDAERHAAVLEWYRVGERDGLGAAAALAERLAREDPEEPVARRLRAVAASRQGRPHEALAAFAELLARFPGNRWLMGDYLAALQGTGDLARIRETLEPLVEGRRMPAVDARQEWRHPPASWIALYARHLGNVDAPRAERLLVNAMRRMGPNVPCLGALGTLRRARNAVDAELPLRLASLGAPENGFYAGAAAEQRWRRGDVDGAVAFLRARAERLSGQDQGGGDAVAELAQALLDYGRPEEAVAVARKRLEERPDDPYFDRRLVRLWIHLGEWKEAEAAAARLAASGGRVDVLGARTGIARARGDWNEGFADARALADECPDNADAHGPLLEFIRQIEGADAALAAARDWVAAHPRHEDFEILLHDALRREDRSDEADALLLERFRRDPDNLWTLIRRTSALVRQARRRRPGERGELLDEAGRCVDHAARLQPGCAAVPALRAEILAASGRCDEAVDTMLSALDLEATQELFYRHLWSWTGDAAPEREAGVRRRMERAWAGGLPESLPALYDLAMAVAQRHGPEEARRLVERCRKTGPDAAIWPEILADLLLRHGEGKRSAEQAVTLLQPALERFPAHERLWISAAQAREEAGHPLKARETYAERVERAPRNSWARFRLARVTMDHAARHGDARERDEALRMAAEAVTRDPAAAQSWIGLARLRLESDLPDEAERTLREGLERNPDTQELRDELAWFLARRGRREEAAAVAEEGVRRRPGDAAALTAKARIAVTEETPVPEGEAVWQAALEADFENYEAADELAVLAFRREESAGGTAAGAILAPYADWPETAMVAKGRLIWLEKQKDGRAAHAAMGRHLKRYPYYRWGWQQLLAWIDGDGDAEGLGRWLRSVPGSMERDVDWRLGRLYAWDRLNPHVPEAFRRTERDLDAEWRRLTGNFPDDPALASRAFDRLMERKNAQAFQAAGELLNAAVVRHPSDPMLRARRVEWFVAMEQAHSAVEETKAFFGFRSDENRWPELHAWECLPAPQREKVAEWLYGMVRSGHVVRPAAFAAALEAFPPAPARRTGWWVGARRRAVRALREWTGHAAAFAERDGGECLAAVVNALNNRGAYGAVWRWAGRNFDLARRYDAVWMEVGRSLWPLGRRYRVGAWKGAADEWLADWRERAQATAWVVQRVCESLRARLDKVWSSRRAVALRAALVDTARDGAARLAAEGGLSPDLVLLLGEALLRDRRDDDFAEAMRRYREVLDQPGFVDAAMNAGGPNHPALVLRFAMLHLDKVMNARDRRDLEACYADVRRSGHITLWPKWLRRGLKRGWRRAVCRHMEGMGGWFWRFRLFINGV